ncbi:MAG: recombinase family protein [Burkholderiaceae bacterium]|nr:MAG: recombinase family protein [Burkholderiaceae bacterium]
MNKPSASGERIVAYYRVSTQRQGRSGLGLEAQREAVHRYMQGHPTELLGEFEEVETGKGSNALDKRPKLRAAVALAKKARATLLIAKLDRLARNVHFVSGLMETGVQFRCCDFPTADRTMIHIYAAMAEHEGRRISERIRDALAAKKARGEAVGNPASLQPVNGARASQAGEFAAKLRPTLEGYRAAGMTQRDMVAALDGAGVRTARGGTWSLMQVQRVLARL